MMEIGKLDKRVTLQRRSATLDAYGQEVNTWVTAATVWANVRPVSGKEKSSMATIDAMMTHKVTVRYNVDFMPPTKVDAWRIVYPTKAGTRIFDIKAAQDVDEARTHIMFDCQEGSQTGAG
jgi:SPP1 family predicted phage head-tail adaptor